MFHVGFYQYRPNKRWKLGLCLSGHFPGAGAGRSEGYLVIPRYLQSVYLRTENRACPAVRMGDSSHNLVEAGAALLGS